MSLTWKITMSIQNDIDFIKYVVQQKLKMIYKVGCNVTKNSKPIGPLLSYF